MKNKIKLITATLLISISLPLSYLNQSAFADSCIDGATTAMGAGVNCAKPTNAIICMFGEECAYNKLINTALFVLGSISVLMMIYGGLRYMLSAGNSSAVTAAKNTIVYAIVGLVIAMLSFAISNFVINSIK